jgi:hypothetical protein
LTFDQRFIIAKIGQVPPALMRQTDACLKAALGLP